jgi:hypothetical protein
MLAMCGMQLADGKWDSRNEDIEMCGRYSLFDIGADKITLTNEGVKHLAGDRAHYARATSMVRAPHIGLIIEISFNDGQSWRTAQARWYGVKVGGLIELIEIDSSWNITAVRNIDKMRGRKTATRTGTVEESYIPGTHDTAIRDGVKRSRILENTWDMVEGAGAPKPAKKRRLLPSAKSFLDNPCFVSDEIEEILDNAAVETWQAVLMTSVLNEEGEAQGVYNRTPTGYTSWYTDLCFQTSRDKMRHATEWMSKFNDLNANYTAQEQLHEAAKSKYEMEATRKSHCNVKSRRHQDTFARDDLKLIGGMEEEAYQWVASARSDGDFVAYLHVAMVLGPLKTALIARHNDEEMKVGILLHCPPGSRTFLGPDAPGGRPPLPLEAFPSCS